MRFYISNPVGNAAQITLTGPEQHHLVHVYRVAPGMAVELFDSTGKCYAAKVKFCTEQTVELEILKQQPVTQQGHVEIILAQSFIKSQHWDLLLEKAMELGLDTLLPMIPQHLASGQHTAGKEERWQRVMIAAAKQCGRNSLISIQPPRSFAQILENTGHIPLRILAHKAPNIPSLKTILDKQTSPPSQVLVMIGPEGGFSNQELQAAQAAGVQFAHLGENILRAETAAWVSISFIQMYFAV